MNIKPIGVLASANLVSQAIQLSMLAIIANLYTPELFNDFVQVVTLSAFWGVIFTLQFNIVIVKQNTNKDRAKILNSGFWIVLATFSVCSLVAIGLFGFIVNNNAFFYVLLSSIFSTLFIALSNMFRGYLSSVKVYKLISYSAIFRAITLSIFQVALSYSPFDNGLIVSIIVTEALVCFYFFLIVKVFPKKTNVQTILLNIKNNKSFALTGVLQEIVSMSFLLSMLFYIGYEFGSLYGGLFAFAHRLLWGPLMLIASAASQVLLREFSRHKVETVLKSPFFRLKIDVLILPIVLVFTSGYIEEAFLYLFSDKWGGSASVFSKIIVWGYFFALSLPYRVMVRVMNKQIVQLKIDISCILLMYVVVFLFDFDFVQTVVLITTIGVIQNILILLCVRWIILNERR